MSKTNSNLIDKAYLNEFWEHRVKKVPEIVQYKKDENDENSIGLETKNKTIIGAINELKRGNGGMDSSIYANSITYSELQQLDTTQLKPGIFYSVYNTFENDIYSGDFTHDGDNFPAGTFLKWTGEKWVYDPSLSNDEYRSTCLYQRSFAFYQSAGTNVYADDTWVCIWEWETITGKAEKCGISFLCKSTCSDQHKGYVTRFTVDSRSTYDAGLPYSYIDCEYLVVQQHSNASYWSMPIDDLRSFFRTTVDGHIYRLYAHINPDMNGFSGVDFMYPAWSVQDDGFKNPIPITKESVIKWENHLGQEITKINYMATGSNCNAETWVSSDFEFTNPDTPKDETEETNENQSNG